MTYVIACRNGATGKLSHYLGWIQRHADTGDLTNGSPTR